MEIPKMRNGFSDRNDSRTGGIWSSKASNASALHGCVGGVGRCRMDVHAGSDGADEGETSQSARTTSRPGFGARDLGAWTDCCITFTFKALPLRILPEAILCARAQANRKSDARGSRPKGGGFYAAPRELLRVARYIWCSCRSSQQRKSREADSNNVTIRILHCVIDQGIEHEVSIRIAGSEADIPPFSFGSIPAKREPTTEGALQRWMSWTEGPPNKKTPTRARVRHGGARLPAVHATCVAETPRD